MPNAPTPSSVTKLPAFNAANVDSWRMLWVQMAQSQKLILSGILASAFLICAAIWIINIGQTAQQSKQIESQYLTEAQNRILIAKDAFSETLLNTANDQQIQSLLATYAQPKSMMILSEAAQIKRAGDVSIILPDLSAIDGSISGFQRYDAATLHKNNVIAVWQPVGPDSYLMTLQILPGQNMIWPWIASIFTVILAVLLLLIFARAFHREIEQQKSIDRIAAENDLFRTQNIGIWRLAFHRQDRPNHLNSNMQQQANFGLNYHINLPAQVMATLGYGFEDRVCLLRDLLAMTEAEDAEKLKAFLLPQFFKLRGQAPFHECIIRLKDVQHKNRAFLLTRQQENQEPSADFGAILPIQSDILQSEKLKSLQSQLQIAIDTMPEAFVLWDKMGRLLYWNRKFCNIFQIVPSQLKSGLLAKDVGANIKDGQAAFAQYFAPNLQDNDVTSEVALPQNRWGMVTRKRTQDGGWVCLAANITEIKNRAKAHIRKERELELTVHQLENSQSELKDALQKYASEKEKAEEASRSKSTFLANMSHELRTPLNAINGFSEVMQAELFGKLGHEKYTEYVNDILASGRHLLTLIDDILDMSKIEAGKMQVNLEHIDLRETLEDAVRFMQPECKEKDIYIQFLQKELPRPLADQRAVKQVILNLLSNAVKFSAQGATINLTIRQEEESITIIVADTGEGMSFDKLQRLGAPFESTQSPLSAKSGTGLGLALSKSLMELQNGILALASEKGKGTVAAFTLPLFKSAQVTLPDFLQPTAHILTVKKLDWGSEEATSQLQQHNPYRDQVGSDNSAYRQDTQLSSLPSHGSSYKLSELKRISGS